MRNSIARVLRLPGNEGDGSPAHALRIKKTPATSGSARPSQHDLRDPCDQPGLATRLACSALNAGAAQGLALRNCAIGHCASRELVWQIWRARRRGRLKWGQHHFRPQGACARLRRPFCRRCPKPPLLRVTARQSDRQARGRNRSTVHKAEWRCRRASAKAR